MKDPATKYLKIVSGQEVNLSPSGIVVKCCDDTVKIEVLKNGKINLFAQNEIQIMVDEHIAVNSKRRVKVFGGESIKFESAQGGSLTLDEDGNIIVTGIEVHMN